MTDSVVGKRVLVDVLEYDFDQRIRLDANCVGVIETVTTNAVHIRCEGRPDLLQLAATVDLFETAEPGTYRLRTGEIVPQPDYIARWTHYDMLSGYGQVILDVPADPDDGSVPPAA